MLQPSRPAGTFKLKVYYVCSYLPSLAGYVQRSPLFLSRSFLSLSFIPLFSSLLFKENRAPFIVPLSSGLQTHTQKREPYTTTTTAISLSASQNILYIWCVCSVYPSVCPTFCLPLPLIQLRKREK